MQAKGQQRNFRVAPHIRPNRHDRYLRVFYPTTSQYTFFSAAHGTSPK
jgi:hypothetical protein